MGITPSPTLERLTPAELLRIADRMACIGMHGALLAEADALRAHATYLETQEADADKVKAFNLLLTAVSPTVRRLAERYLEGVKDYDAFVEFLRTHPRPQLQDADIDEDCR